MTLEEVLAQGELSDEEDGRLEAPAEGPPATVGLNDLLAMASDSSEERPVEPLEEPVEDVLGPWLPIFWGPIGVSYRILSRFQFPFGGISVKRCLKEGSIWCWKSVFEAQG